MICGDIITVYLPRCSTGTDYRDSPDIVTVDGNISKCNKTDFIDRDGTYIILIPDGDLKSFKAEIIWLPEGQKHRFKIFWNSEARFPVAGANEYSMSQQTDIFDYFS